MLVSSVCMSKVVKITSSDFKANDGPRPRFPVYFYPKKNQQYADFVERFKPRGNAGALRKLLVEGFDQARDEITQWISLVAEHGRAVPFPIVDNDPDSTQRSEPRHDVYLSVKDNAHAPIIAYLRGPLRDAERRLQFKEGELRQQFLRLALVRGSQKPDIDDILRGI